MVKKKIVRKGKNYFQGDRVRKGKWTKKRWSKSKSSDAKRDGSKYEKWEKPHGRKRKKPAKKKSRGFLAGLP